MLEVEHLEKSYVRGKAALSDLSFSVKAGEKVALLGANGAGKTTTFRILLGLLRPDKGQVKLDGIDVGTKPQSVQRMVGYLPESAPLYPELTPKEYLCSLARFYQLPKTKTRLEELCALCELESVWQRLCGALSKGYRQRVALAAALLHEPRLLVLDEPTAGLDPRQVEHFRQMLAKLSKNQAVLLSTHVLSEVEAVCDRVYMLKNGKMAGHWKLPLAAAGLWEILWRAKAWPAGLGRLCQSEKKEDGWQQSLLNPESLTPEQCLAKIVGAGVELRSFFRRPEKLEDLFLRVTTDSKTTDSKETGAKETDSKETDSKETDSKTTDSKTTDSKTTDSKTTDSKETGAKETDSKETGARV